MKKARKKKNGKAKDILGLMPGFSILLFLGIFAGYIGGFMDLTVNILVILLAAQSLFVGFISLSNQTASERREEQREDAAQKRHEEMMAHMQDRHEEMVKAILNMNRRRRR